MSNGSTGPTTIEGKARSSRNAYKHGIRTGRFLIQPYEDPEDFEDFRAGIYASYDLVTDLEYALADRLVVALWLRRRLDYHIGALTIRRVASAEKDLQLGDAYAQGTVSKGEYPDVTEVRIVAEQLSRTILPADDLQANMRNEAHLRRECTSLMHELEALITRRNGGHAPLARLDVSGSEG